MAPHEAAGPVRVHGTRQRGEAALRAHPPAPGRHRARRRRRCREGRDRRSRRRVNVPPRPMLATLSPEVVTGPEWVFEEKYDGIRAIATRQAGAVRLWSRMLQDLTAGFPEIVAAVRALPDGDLALDGELVSLDEHGVSRFQLLQRRGTKGATAPRYAVVDILELDGRSLCSRPLAERRTALEK